MTTEYADVSSRPVPENTSVPAWMLVRYLLALNPRVATNYRLVDDDKRFYYDTTGTGNSLNVRHHESLRLMMDSLRYWVTEMHVDGFRFDLAATLAREFHEVDRLAAFFDLVNQDPIVSQVKLIAEPWTSATAATRSAAFLHCGRSGTASTATPCATSGTASLERWANSLSASPDHRICTRSTAGAPLATLLLPQGVPMLCHGDELGRTQLGNNNVYCQDNELSWIDWDAARDNEALTRFTAQLVRLRAEHPLFRRRHFFDGRPVGDAGATDVAWFRRDGAPMTQPDWTTDTVEL